MLKETQTNKKDMAKDKAVLTTDEEIRKALAELQDEGFLSKAEGADDDEGKNDPEDDDEDDKGDAGEGGTNAKVGDDDDDDDQTEKGKKAPAKKADDMEDDKEVEKAIDAEPILKAFSERQEEIMAKQNELDAKLDTVLKAISKMSINSAIVLKGVTEKVSAMDDIQKAVEDVHKFSTGRRTMGANPHERFEKGETGEGGGTVVDIRTQGGHDTVLGVLEKALYDSRGNIKPEVPQTLVQDMKRFSVQPSYMSKGIMAECTKAGILVKGFE